MKTLNRPDLKAGVLSLEVVTPILAPSPTTVKALKQKELAKIKKWWNDRGVDDEALDHLDRVFERTSRGDVFISLISLTSSTRETYDPNAMIWGVLVFPPDSLTIRVFSVNKESKQTVIIAEAISPGTKVRAPVLTNMKPGQYRVSIGWRKGKGYGLVDYTIELLEKR